MSEIKYEAVFGPQELFNNEFEPNAIAVIFIDRINKLHATSETEIDRQLQRTGSYVVAMRRIIKTPVQHSDDIAVDLFAAKMKEKLAKSRDKGRGGWEDCTIEYLITSLKDHILKGDPVDVANFSMMISLRGESIKTPVWTVADQKAGRLPEVGSKYLGKNELNPEAELICDLIDGDECVWGHDKNKKMFCFYASNIKPIETPDEKAQREEDEFVAAMLDAASQEQLMSAGFKSGVIAAYRKLKGGE